MSSWRLVASTAVLAGLSLVVPACGEEDSPAEPTEAAVRVTLPFESAIEYHPWYIAQELGYFEDEGIQVEIDIADGSAGAIQQVLAGNTDVAISSPGAFLNGVAAGQEIRWVYSYLYSNIFTLVTLPDSGISSVDDLRGKRLGISDLAGGEVPLVRAVLRDAGLREGVDVELVAVGEGSALTAESLTSGEIDAYSSSVYDVAAIRAAGVDLTVILPEELLQYPSDGVVVTTQTLESRSDVLESFLRAVSKAIVFADSNPQAAIEVTSKAAPEEFEDPVLAQAFWDATIEIRVPPSELAGEPIGSHFVSGFELYHDFLLEGTEEEGALPEAVDLSEALDNSLLAGANNFDRAAIEEEAETYSA